MIKNKEGTITLSSGTDDDRSPFAMPKNSLSVRFPKNPKNAANIVPKGTNSIFLFTGEEYVSVALNTIENSYCGDLYEKAGEYLEKNKPDYLFGISVSGGDGYWTTDKIERFANDIETGVIKYGNYKNYRENGSKTKYFNTVVIDLERLSDSSPGSGIYTEEDKAAYQNKLLIMFTDCFQRIKQTAPWCIVVTEAHSGTFNASHDFLDGMNKCEYVDYFSPQLYTWSYTGCNEYTRTKNNLYSWGKFYKSIINNPLYVYRLSSMITPSLGFTNDSFKVNGFYGRSSIADDNWGSYIDIPDKLFNGVYTGLYKGAGTNKDSPPFFEVEDSILTTDEKPEGFPNPDNKTFHLTYPTGTDLGAADFFGKMFRKGDVNQPIGGSIQFSNGFLTF